MTLRAPSRTSCWVPWQMAPKRPWMGRTVKMRDYRTAKGLPEPQGTEGRRGGPAAVPPEWIAAFKGGPATAGSLLNAASCSEAIALAGAAIRYRRKIFPDERKTVA